ncbi:MAG TPA: hypothetical protein VJ436_10705 [Anaerolineales bacterium]|nr:hypothetical protein [Anaerolineales bacterium]
MALAQVVYQISTDADFAARMRTDPEGALAERGWRLSKEELAFLWKAITRTAQGKDEIMSLARVKPTRAWW